MEWSLNNIYSMICGCYDKRMSQVFGPLKKCAYTSNAMNTCRGLQSIATVYPVVAVARVVVVVVVVVQAQVNKIDNTATTGIDIEREKRIIPTPTPTIDKQNVCFYLPFRIGIFFEEISCTQPVLFDRFHCMKERKKKKKKT